ncbi:MAG TPA: ABC transporter ATP-binding protein [Thermomicrobiales bacterium]|nr:ABC transporter ATP-binding protein [Thermomicrobiales bacterium]
MSEDQDRWRPPSRAGARPSPFISDPNGDATGSVWNPRMRRPGDGIHPLVNVEGITREYPMGDNIVHALRGVDLRVMRGQMVAIQGRSGSGKTTLLNIVGGLDRPTAGHVWIDGADVTEMQEMELVNLRRHKIGFIFQAFGLIPILSASENVEVPLRLAMTNVSVRQERVRVLLELVGLGERGGHRPHELSGGEQQRVAIARALANQPEILLADEPTGQLDSQTGRTIMTLIRALVRSEGVTAIVATHDPVLIDLADRVLELSDGRIVADSDAVESPAYAATN